MIGYGVGLAISLPLCIVKHNKRACFVADKLLAKRSSVKKMAWYVNAINYNPASQTDPGATELARIFRKRAPGLACPLRL